MGRLKGVGLEVGEAERSGVRGWGGLKRGGVRGWEG